jgi:hypothetical protein
MDLREQIDEAASDWAFSYPISSWALAEGDAAAKIASIWGKQIGRAVWAVVQPVLDAKDDEIAALRAELALHEAAAPATNNLAKRETARAEQAEATIARVEALHARVNTRYGKACDHCRGSDEEPIPWPCSTIAALAQPDDQEGTAW